MDEIIYDKDDRYFTAKRKAAALTSKSDAESLEEIKKRMLEKYPPAQSEVEKRYAKELTETNIKNFGILMPSKGIPSPPNSDLLNSVISDLEAREQRGINKYGTTMDRNDLDLKAWLEHLYHELLDAALYAKKQITLLDQNDKAAND